MNNLFTNLVTGLVLLFTLNLQANPTFPAFPNNKSDYKTSNHENDFLMDDFIVSGSTVSGDVGDIVCVDVTVENFDNILSFQYSMNFDPTVLQFTEVIDPENINDLNFGDTDTGNGNLGINWFDGDVTGITIPDGTLLYQVCFEIINSNGASVVSFSGNPTSIEVVDGNEDPVNFESNNGTVVTGGSTPLTVSATTVTAANGDNVCLDITANNFTNLNSFQYSMNFDPAVLMFDQTMDAGSLTGLMFDNSGVGSGNLVVNWNSASGVTLANGTSLYQVCFNVIGAGGTSSSFAFSGNPTAIMVTDADGENVTLISNSGGVNVSGGGGNNGSDFTVTAATPTGNVGDVVCVDVTVDNFDNILSFQYSMNFDPALLQFVEVIDPMNIDDLNFGDTDVANGNLNISWFDNDINGITVPDGTLLYQVCFEILGGNGVVPVTFSGNPTSIEVVDGNEDPVVFASNSGGIDVGGTPPAAMLTINAPNVNANNGDQVCLDIKVNGFTNLTSFQYNVAFDESVLTFDQNIDANALTGLMFDNSGAANGNLSVSWNSASGVTLNNSTTIYQACFNVIGAGGTSSNYAISGGMATDTDGAINFNGNNGSVSVSMPNNGTDFIVTAGTPSGNVGDVVCVDVTVENFNNILSFQYSMNFDPALLQFVEVVDPMNIDDLNFGDTDVANGNLGISWFDNDVNGITVPDGTVLYQVCFEILGGANGQTIPVTFSGSPTSIEVVDGNEDPVVFASNSGGVTIGDPGTATVTFLAPTMMANNGDNVCLNVTTNGFTNLTDFQYTINFDPAILSFTQNMDAGNLTGLTFNTANAANGTITVSWNSASGVTLANGTSLYQACFNVIGAGGTSSNYTFSNGTATDADGAMVNVSGNNGAVNVATPNNGTDLIVTIETAPGNVGDQVCLAVTVENFNNVLSFQYSMNFDPTLLQFVQVIDPENIEDLNFGESDVANGNLTVSWFDNDVNGITVPDGTVIYEVCFTILDDNNGNPITVSISDDPTAIEAVDGNEDPIVFVGVPGGIGDGGDPPNPDPIVTFAAPTMSVNNGDNICLDITTNGFTNLANFQYTFNYNASVLGFDQNISSGNLSNIMFDNSGASSGNLTVSWDNNGTGVTLPDGTVLYQVCFIVNGSGGSSSTLSFINGTATDGDNGNVNVNSSNGVINVLTPNNGTDFIVTGSAVEGEVGDIVCVDVTVENFNNILSFQYSMNFDPTLLEFNEILDPENIPDLNFGISGVDQGNIGVSWFDNDVNGVTIPDGTLLYQVCFTIIGGNNGQVIPVTFSGEPTDIEVVDGNEDPVVFASNNGSVIINTPPPPNAVNFIFSNEMGAPGETVCIPLTTTNFNDVNSMQYSFCYDCSLLTFIEYANPNTTLTTAGSLNASNPNPCELTLSWFDEDINGETLSDNETIIEVCFQINPSATDGQISPVSVCETPAIIEIADENSNLIPFNLVNGSIEVEVGSPCMGPITISNQNVMNVMPCAGANNGAIDITDAGGNGTGANNYSWVNVDNPNAVLSTMQDLDNVGPGTYEVTITGCAGNDAQTFTQEFTIIEPAPITINVTPTPVACNGENTGAISTTVSGGSGMSYTYNWNPSTVTGANPTGLSAGTYALTVTDSEGCSTSFGPIEITEPSEPFTATTSVTNPACSGETGSIMVNAMGGTTAYSYSLNGTTAQNNPLFDGLMPGMYDVLATDMNGCTVSLTDIEITEPAEITITENSSSPDLGNCEGAISIDISGGNPGGFTYNWTGPDPDAPFSSQNISGLCAGEYCVTATDNVGGCTATFCKTLIQPLTVTLVSSQNACFENCNGSAIIDIVGGDGDYSVLWMPGNQMVINPVNLCADTNTVTVMSGDGQTATLEVVIEAPTSPVVINNPVLNNPTSSTECTGSISISPAGGYGAPYTVTWMPPQSGTTTITDLCAGTYTATVTDSNGCTTEASYTLESPDLEIIDLASTAVSCDGNEDGAISFGVVGGTTPYDVVVMGDMVVNPDTGTTYSYSNLSAGVYLITVTDGAGTVVTTTVEVMDGEEITTEIIKIVDFTSSSLGSIQITQPTGGTPPYTFLWSNGSGAMNPDNLNPGTYSLTITDAVGCFNTYIDFATVYLFEITNSETVDPPCSGNPVGSIAIEATEVTNNLPFTYEWEDGDGNPVGTNSPELTNVPGGTYTVTVTDACGTSINETFVLVANSNLDLDVEATSFFNGFNIRCNGGTSGSAEAIPDNGTAPYIYNWSNGTSGTSINSVGAGTYSVTVSDNVGCTAESAITLTEPDAINIDFIIDSISCNGQGDGFINANVSGGVPTGGYNYFWNNGEADNNVGPVGPGNYSVEVTDGNDCEVEAMVPLPEPEVLDFTFATTPVTETELGSIELFPTGGTQPYFYTWPAGIEGENIVTDLNFGTYAVIVTDANGCTKMNTGIQVQLNTDCFQGSPVVTPNDDSLNDVFRISCSERVQNLEIFNRWGQLVYEADTYADEWDGTTRRGSEVPEGTYFYIFEYMDVNTGETEQVRGSLTLLRN